jgi:hypothetical protein
VSTGLRPVHDASETPALPNSLAVHGVLLPLRPRRASSWSGRRLPAGSQRRSEWIRKRPAGSRRCDQDKTLAVHGVLLPLRPRRASSWSGRRLPAGSWRCLERTRKRPAGCRRAIRRRTFRDPVPQWRRKSHDRARGASGVGAIGSRRISLPARSSQATPACVAAGTDMKLGPACGPGTRRLYNKNRIFCQRTFSTGLRIRGAVRAALAWRHGG